MTETQTLNLVNYYIDVRKKVKFLPTTVNWSVKKKKVSKLETTKKIKRRGSFPEIVLSCHIHVGK